jgi:hypothetical protein
VTATMATKGHLMAGDGSGVPSMLGVGTNDYVLTADSGEATGIKWAAATGAATVIATGTYTGDGATSQAITAGLSGFQIKMVQILVSDTGNADVADHGWVFTTDTYVDNNAAGLAINGDAGNGSGISEVRINMINALGTNSFTVDDNGTDAHPNKNSQVYDFIAWGA